jgi:hypothetical protein
MTYVCRTFILCDIHHRHDYENGCIQSDYAGASLVSNTHPRPIVSCSLAMLQEGVLSDSPFNWFNILPEWTS